MARQIVVDANVFVSFLVERNEKQRAAAKALIDSAGDGEIIVVRKQVEQATTDADGHIGSRSWWERDHMLGTYDSTDYECACDPK